MPCALKLIVLKSSIPKNRRFQMHEGIEDSTDEESDDELLSSVQAGMLLGVGPERMRQLANAGEVPVINTPLGRLFRMRDVEGLMERREAQGGDWASRWLARLPAPPRRK